MFIKKKDYENLLEELRIAKAWANIYHDLYYDQIERTKGEIKESNKWREACMKRYNETEEK